MYLKKHGNQIIQELFTSKECFQVSFTLCLWIIKAFSMGKKQGETNMRVPSILFFPLN